MSTSTYITFLNANDPVFQKALTDPEVKMDWEEDHGPIDRNPGREIYTDESAVEETDDEYGGWVIDLSKIPKDATHIKVTRF